MRVALIHNETAGNSSYGREDLVALLSAMGHRAQVFDNTKRDVRRAIRSSPDVMVAAGGDGTVARAATILHKSRSAVPLYILPVGTANNIAHTLGLGDDDVPELVFALANARRRRFDVGTVRSSWAKTQRFVEAAGFGFIGRMLELDGTMRERMGRAKRALRGAFGARLSRAEKSTHGVARLIREQSPIACRVRADGEDLDGDYIAVEALNVREIGPRVSLAPRARYDDRRLDLLLVRESDREALARYTESGGTSALVPPGVRRRVRKVKLSWPKSGGHLDDEPWPCDAHNGSDDRVRIKAARPIEVLLPRR
jgi:diacylglycerol kinase (ATP)